MNQIELFRCIAIFSGAFNRVLLLVLLLLEKEKLLSFTSLELRLSQRTNLSSWLRDKKSVRKMDAEKKPLLLFLHVLLSSD